MRALLLGAVILGCSGGLVGCPGGTPEGPGELDAVCEAQGTPAAPLRLLTRSEVDRSVQDLLGVEGSARDRLPDDPTVHGFEGFAETVGVSQLHADAMMRASEDVTDRIDWNLLLPCDVTVGGAPCAEAFLDEFGRRAFRRPLRGDERGIFTNLYEEVAAEQGFTAGVASLVQAILQSPQFLYRIEIGDPESSGPIVPLTSYELATRLASLLWASTPDEALLSAAADGSLLEPGGIEEHVDRMLEDRRAREVVGRFVEQWTGITGLERAVKDPLAFPSWSPDLAADLREETRRFAADVVFDGDGTLDALLTSSHTVANLTVADHYGTLGPIAEAEWERLELPPSQRAGLLTHPSLMASAAHSNQTSPVHRGLFIFEQLFCGVQPEPPGDLDITLPPLDDSISTRERFARHTQDPLCADCHSFMDPIGFGFENYDAVGVWRDVEDGGIPVDSSGLLTYSSQQGSFTGAVELAMKVAAAPEVDACFVTQWFRSSWGRDVTDSDNCTTQLLAEAFEDGDVLELLRAIPTTPSFQSRPAVTP